MRKQWLGICIAAGLLAACSGEDVQQKTVSVPQPAVCNGPTVEISGADPRFETLNATANQDYERDGKSYKIVQDPANFTQTGLAAIYDAEPNSNLTASGEAFDPTQLTAAHPTLPIPSYARITNLANGRMIVVRINDRGPYGNDRVISLSRASADRLNTSNNTKVRIDPIIVSQDGALSGPGMACTTVAKQTYALPSRPNLDGDGSAAIAPADQSNVHAISNSTRAGKQRTCCCACRRRRDAGNTQRSGHRAGLDSGKCGACRDRSSSRDCCRTSRQHQRRVRRAGRRR